MPSVGKQHIPQITQLNAGNVRQELQKANLGEVLSKKEANFVNGVLAKFGGVPGVKDDLQALLKDVKVPDPTMIAATVAALGGTGTTAPVSTGGGAGSSTTIGTQTGGLRPQNTNSIDVLHFEGEGKIVSDFKFKKDVLRDWYDGVPEEKFGTTKVVMQGHSYEVHDMQYQMSNGEVGMYLVPAADIGKTVVDKTGKVVPGSQLIDDVLRKEMDLGPDDEIYAFMSFIHPEAFEGDLKSLGGEKLKTEMGNTHLAAYRGKGKTTNSPLNYHNKTFGLVDGRLGYPANMTVISMDGVPQKTLNKNFALVDGALNEEVLFPSDYKEDIFRAVDMPTTMMFYRDYIRKLPYLRTENSWKTYCAEHKTNVGNVAVNLPHNEARFKQMFGDADGAQLWSEFKVGFERREGRPFTAADETEFKPLWEQEGAKLTDVQPYKDKAEYDAYNDARQAGTLATFTGRRPSEPGKAMMWPPETTADLMSDFIESYASFKHAGAFAASSAIMGFMGTITDRMGISSEKFTTMAMPVINKLVIAEAMATAPGQSASGWMDKAKASMFHAFGGPDAAGDPTKLAQINGLVELALKGVKTQIDGIVASPVPANGKVAREGAHTWLRANIQMDIEKARRVSVADGSKVEFYSPPAVVNRVVLGMHESSKFLHFRTVATIVEGDHMEPK